VVVLSDLKDKPLEEAIRLLRDVHLPVFDRAAGRYARLAARFSVVDGIVVMSSLLEPLVFGALTSVPLEFTEVSDKGARHRSAAYCASRLPGSLAIVVSQDGSVRAYRKAAADVPVEEAEVLL
jgi:DNA integrity scanning protein DisA with diadenylate cyclase activity